MRIGKLKVTEQRATFEGSKGAYERCNVSLSGEYGAVFSIVESLHLSTANIREEETVLMEMTMSQALWEIGEDLKRGNRINAIKRVREFTGLGLKESKDIVDAFQTPPSVGTFTVR